MLIPLFRKGKVGDSPVFLGVGEDQMLFTPFLKEEEEIYPISFKLVATLTYLRSGIVLIAKFYIFSVAKTERGICLCRRQSRKQKP